VSASVQAMSTFNDLDTGRPRLWRPDRPGERDGGKGHNDRSRHPASRRQAGSLTRHPFFVSAPL
jgi:hypothetical protein